jgi:hypothetical protein
MPANHRAAFLVLLFISMRGGLALSQNAPALLVVPSKATMLVGETREFRAVAKDGRIRHNVQWSISPESAATLTIQGDEATVNAVGEFAAVVLTAHDGGESSEAVIEVRAGRALSPGTQLWSVTPLPSCKAVNMTQAVPSANGPDLYVQESCPQGSFIRAMTADGRELWRKNASELSGTRLPAVKTSEQTQPGNHLYLSGRSLCDAVSAGMSKDTVSKLAKSSNVRLSEKEKQSDTWEIEEQGFRCDILFDKSGAVVKKKKTILTE